MGDVSVSLPMGDELKIKKAFKEMLVHLRSGGLNHDRKGSEGENLDVFPIEPGLDFSIEINGDLDYRLTLGQRTERQGNSPFIWLFCRLEYIARRGKNWVQLEHFVSANRWRAVADPESNRFTMRQPFGVFIYSIDYLAVSTSRFGSTIYEGRAPEMLAAAAKLFEKGKL